MATYTAVDPEGASVSWSLGTGGQSGLFDISGGVLTFKDSPDYETPAAEVIENEYTVTIMATDETNKVGMEEVKVKVTNVDRGGDGDAFGAASAVQHRPLPPSCPIRTAA